MSEKPAKYYDRIYSSNEEYKKHYLQSIYYPVWKQAAAFIPVTDKVFEIGCGAGHFGHILHNNNVERYRGIDFSAHAVFMARSRCKMSFYVDDIYTSKEWQQPYDTLVALEVLEHLDDLKVMSMVNHGTRIVASLPTFMCDAHLICFENDRQICERYEGVIDIMDVVKVGKWFVFWGVKL